MKTTKVDKIITVLLCAIATLSISIILVGATKGLSPLETTLCLKEEVVFSYINKTNLMTTKCSYLQGIN